MVEVNLLPAQYRKQSQPSVWKYATWALLPITAVALLIPWLMTSTKTSDLQRQIDAVQGDIDTLTPAKHEYDTLVAHQQDLNQVTAIAKTLRDQKTYWSNDLAAFSAQVPANSGIGLTKMDITSVNADALANIQKSGIYPGKLVRRQISLEGNATSEQAVITFLNAMENSSNFGVSFKGMERQSKDQLYTFKADVGVVGTPSTAEQSGVTSSAAAPAAASAPQTSAPAISPAARSAAASGDSNVK
ncbi:fimbrial assembly protein [Deinococcus sp.]|uniref:fimbrial assembly protein n=1 Tax=Deinococcus sp. TaxID=47478 RepID=UPI0025C24916|nr:fimbrial assembly protein [Deinococcus sp.]